MSGSLDQLTTKISSMESVGDGMAALLADLSARIKAAGTDAGKLSALASEVDTHTAVWAKAVTDNTSAAGDTGAVASTDANAVPAVDTGADASTDASAL